MTHGSSWDMEIGLPSAAPSCDIFNLGWSYFHTFFTIMCFQCLATVFNGSASDLACGLLVISGWSFLQRNRATPEHRGHFRTHHVDAAAISGGQQSNNRHLTMTCHFSISNVRFAFWAFFRKQENLGSHTGSKWRPGDPDVKDDPNDPLTR